MIPQILVDEDIKKWIKIDIPFWDITANLLPDKNTSGKIYSKQEGIIAGLPFAKRVFELMKCEFKPLIKEGAYVEKKKAIAEVKGDVKDLLQAERTAINLLGRLSGIATLTNRMIQKAREINENIQVSSTRKVMLGFAKYDKYAVTIGGGDTHRFDLSDMILLKENHLRFFDSVKDAVLYAKEKTSFTKKIEVEVQNDEQAIEAAEAGAEIIMLDNFSAQQVKIVVPKIREILPNVLIELSGNVNLKNIDIYPLELLNLISSGALTHSVENFDLTMLV